MVSLNPAHTHPHQCRTSLHLLSEGPLIQNFFQLPEVESPIPKEKSLLSICGLYSCLKPHCNFMTISIHRLTFKNISHRSDKIMPRRMSGLRCQLKSTYKEPSDKCLTLQIPRSHSQWNQVQTLLWGWHLPIPAPSPTHTPKGDKVPFPRDLPLLLFTNLPLPGTPLPTLHSVCPNPFHPTRSSAKGFSINGQAFYDFTSQKIAFFPL